MAILSTLQNIRTKIRRLTGRPSKQQITNDQINEYINTFYQCDFPEHLRVFSNNGTFKFITIPNVDQYNMLSKTPATPKFNELIVDFSGSPVQAQDVYYNLEPPVYINGYKTSYSQSREQFFLMYPALGNIDISKKGNGTPGPYEFDISSSPILQNSVTIGTIDSTNNTIRVIDKPETRSTGSWLISNSEIAPTGSIDYLTGAVSITFINDIPIGKEITVTSTPYQANRPHSVLFFNNMVTVRPVPDKPYPVEFNAFLTPTALLSDTQNPIIKQWWQYLAYGAAKKILEDSQDMEGVEKIMGAFKEQESLVLNRHIVQQTNERTATIYTEMSSFSYGNFNNGF